MNSVKLYSNGSAVISKKIVLLGATKVSIPVNKSDLDDVVSSISVFGNVVLPKPPSYTPTNSTTTALKLNGEQILRDLAVKLRGANVEVEVGSGTKYIGILYGIQAFQQETNGSVFDRFRILVGTETGIQQFDDNCQLRFIDSAVQDEINKSLQISLQEIKPDSRFVELTLVPKDGAREATISYATPVAAWKIRYQLRFINGAATIEGQAIVDNDTDDDWKDVSLSVITGDPISFSTDVAEIRRPTRSRVNVVSDKAIGAVQAESTIRIRPTAKRAMAASSFDDECGLESCHVGSAVGSSEPIQTSVVSESEIKESGDFSIYTAPDPVTILSKKSAIIGLFSFPLTQAKTILLYKGDQESVRPYRVVKATNTLGSLGKGVCEVYVDGDRQGKCVVEATKPNEEILLIHAVENGVKVFKEVRPQENRQISLKISNGVIYNEQLATLVTEYKVDNAKAEKFDFDIEHTRNWAGSQLFVSVVESDSSKVDTKSGIRISSELLASGTLTVTVTEKFVVANAWAVNSHWLLSSVVSNSHPLSKNPAILEVVALQQKVDEIQQQIQETEDLVQTEEREQTRLISLIPNVHEVQARIYKNDLVEAETAIRTARKQLPELKKQLIAANNAVNKALSNLKTEWHEENSGQLEENEDKWSD